MPLETGFRGKSTGELTLCLALGVVFLGIGVFGSFAVTEIAQFLDWPRSWVVNFYEYRWPLTFVMVIAFCGAIFVNYRQRFVPQFLAFIGVAGVITMIYVINYMVPYLFFPAQHHTAKFIDVSEIRAMAVDTNPMALADEDRVYVIENKGDAVAYPQEVLWVPHIAGTQIGGEDIVMAYCVLSNLPLGFGTNVGGQVADFKVMSQVHNNLIMTDVNSGDLVQHMWGKTEFGGIELDNYPVQMMPWGSFKKLYPQGRVFFNNYDDDFMPRLWKEKAGPAMDLQFNSPDPLFPTLRMDDDRLAPKDQVWAMDVNGQQLAVSRSYFDQNPVSYIELGGAQFVMAYFDDLDTVGLFDRTLNGQLVDAMDVDPYGNTSSGQLTRTKLFNGVFWMVWSHWFPESGVLN